MPALCPGNRRLLVEDRPRARAVSRTATAIKAHDDPFRLVENAAFVDSEKNIKSE